MKQLQIRYEAKESPTNNYLKEHELNSHMKRIENIKHRENKVTVPVLKEKKILINTFDICINILILFI